MPIQTYNSIVPVGANDFCFVSVEILRIWQRIRIIIAVTRHQVEYNQNQHSLVQVLDIVCKLNVMVDASIEAYPGLILLNLC